MSTFRLSLGMIVGVLLLSAQSGAAPAPILGGRSWRDKRATKRARQNQRAGASPAPTGLASTRVTLSEGDVLSTRLDHFRFTRVPESVFGKIAWAHRNDTSEDGWAWLGDLPKYGCRKVVLGSWRREPV